MVAVNRRLFVSGLASGFFRRTAPIFVGGMLAVPPTPAGAWVLEAIGIAGSVANLVSGSTGGDGGIGAMLQANHDQLKQVLLDLTSVQARLGLILEKIENQGEEFDRILTNRDKRGLHREVLAAAIGYEEVLKGKDATLPFEEWRRLATTQSSVADYYFRIRKARQLINVTDLLDPTTALVATSACFVEVGLLVLTGARPSEVKSLVRDVYLPWFEKILDPALVGSSAHYAASARSRLTEFEKAAADSDFGRTYGFEPGRKLLVCTGVNDHTPKQTTRRTGPTGCIPIVEAPVRAPRTFAEEQRVFEILSAELGKGTQASVSFGDAPTGTEQTSRRLTEALASVLKPDTGPEGRSHVFMARACFDMSFDTDARNGPRERLARDVILREFEAVSDGRPTGLLQLEVALQEERFGNAGQEGLPAEANCSVDTLDMQDAAERRRHMTGMARRRTAEEVLVKFQVIVAQINLERARIVLGVQAMLATEKARQRLIEFQEQYG